MDDQGTNRESGEAEPDMSARSIITDLTTAAGALVLVMAIPLGLMFGADFFWGDGRWAIIFSGAMMLATAAVGGGLMAIGEFLWRRQQRKK